MEKISELVLSSHSQLPVSIRPDYMRLCRLLDLALETKNIPSYEKLNYEQCRQYAIGRFHGFLKYGVHNYVENQPFIEFDRVFKEGRRIRNNPSRGIRQDHPILNAYFRFTKALDLEPQKFETNNLNACANELDFLFNEFLKQGAKAFATNWYRPIRNDLGIFGYHCCGGPLKYHHQKAIHDIIRAISLESSLRREKLYKEIEENHLKNNPPSFSCRMEGLVDKVKGFFGANSSGQNYLDRKFIED